MGVDVGGNNQNVCGLGIAGGITCDGIHGAMGAPLPNVHTFSCAGGL